MRRLVKLLPVGLLFVASIFSGCSSISTDRTNAIVAGASLGALAGGAMGCGAAAAWGYTSHHTESARDKAFEIGCPAGVGLGALAGGVIAAMTYHPAPPPPPENEIVVYGEGGGLSSAFWTVTSRALNALQDVRLGPLAGKLSATSLVNLVYSSAAKVYYDVPDASINVVQNVGGVLLHITVSSTASRIYSVGPTRAQHCKWTG